MAALDDFMAALAALNSTNAGTVGKLRSRVRAAAVAYQAAVVEPPPVEPPPVEPPPVEPPPVEPRILRAVNEHPIWYRTTPSTWTDLHDALGVQATRFDLIWSVINDGGPPPTGYHLSSAIPATFNAMRVGLIDDYLSWMAARNIQVTAIIGGAPAWASNGQTGYNAGLGAGHGTDYANFCTWVVTRWGDKLEAVELWNEPTGYWAWAPSGVNAEAASFYADNILKPGYAAVKAAGAAHGIEVMVLCGSLFSAGQDARDQVYLRNLYAAGGKDYFDALAVHCYARHCEPVGTRASWDVPLYDPAAPARSLVGRWEASTLPVMRQYGDEGKPVWFNEIGVQTGSTGDAAWERQAATVRAWFTQWQQGGLPANVKRIYYYQLVDGEGGGDSGWGLVNNTGSATQPLPSNMVRKPAFDALATIR